MATKRRNVEIWSCPKKFFKSLGDTAANGQKNAHKNCNHGCELKRMQEDHVCCLWRCVQTQVRQAFLQWAGVTGNGEPEILVSKIVLKPNKRICWTMSSFPVLQFVINGDILIWLTGALWSLTFFGGSGQTVLTYWARLKPETFKKHAWDRLHSE